jgi:hexosaminidase
MFKAKLLIIAVIIMLITSNGIAQKQPLNVMPVPQKVELGKGNFELSADFSVRVSGNPNNRIYPQASRFLQRLSNRTGLFFSQGYVIAATKPSNRELVIDVKRPGEVKFGEDESYELAISDSNILLTATSDFGAIHGLETLLQTLTAAENRYYFPACMIIDEPRFPWRGLMIDVARHFQPVDVIKRNIDGLAAVKMNVLHLHLSDDQGFRVESKLYPKLTLNGSDGYFYTQEQIKDIVKYADERGIRVYPEFDVPGHATAILTAYPEYASKKATYEIERNAGIFDPTLDPTNPKTYEFLNSLFAEMSTLFTDEYFHIGGDENEGRHWDESEDIQRFMKKNKLGSNHDLQAYFNKKLLKNFTELDKKMIGWDEIMHVDLPKTAIIQSWRGLDAMESAAKNGYKTMLSNGFYIDLMHSADSHYLVDPLPDSLNLSAQERNNIIGGEATMWSELVTPFTIDSRIWPRTAVIAERLWSSKNIRDVDDMYRRMEILSLDLERIGLQHQSSRDLILRNIANQNEIQPLQILSGVCQPLQGYTRNPQGTMYQSYSPFMLFADACIADPPGAIEFNRLVAEYVNGNTEYLPGINSYLSLWEQNHTAFKKIAANAPALHSISELSLNLAALAKLGKEAVIYGSTNKKPHKDWIEKSKIIVSKSRQQGGRTELQVVDSIEQLINNCQ